MKTIFFLCSLMIMLFVPAHARDSGQWINSDPAIREWYEALRQPDSPTVSCCGEADAYWCDTVTVEGDKTFCAITDDRDDALLHRPHVDIGTKIEIPNEKLKFGPNDPQRVNASNPTGHTIVFLSSMRYVYCFVLGTGT